MEKIQPIIVGELTCKDQFGRGMVPRVIRFEQDGSASALCYHYLYGDYVSPVTKSNGERLSFPGFAGLQCNYNSGTGSIENFRG